MKIRSLIKSSIFTLLIIGTSINYAIAQSSKNVSVKSFNQVTVSSGIDLYLTQGSTETLTIKGNDDLIKDVIVEQNADAITIRYKEGINWGRLFKNQTIKVYLNYKTLTGLNASGGSDVYAQNNIKSDILNLRASGGSDLKLMITVKDLSLISF